MAESRLHAVPEPPAAREEPAAPAFGFGMDGPAGPPAARTAPAAPAGEPDGEAQDDGPLLRDVIGALLRRTRQGQGRTLKEVADAAQVSLPYLSEVERGRKEPSSEVLAAIRRALGLSMIDLVGGVHMDLAAAEALPASPGRTASLPGGPTALLLAA